VDDRVRPRATQPTAPQARIALYQACGQQTPDTIALCRPRMVCAPCIELHDCAYHCQHQGNRFAYGGADDSEVLVPLLVAELTSSTLLPSSMPCRFIVRWSAAPGMPNVRGARVCFCSAFSFSFAFVCSNCGLRSVCRQVHRMPKAQHGIVVSDGMHWRRCSGRRTARYADLVSSSSRRRADLRRRGTLSSADAADARSPYYRTLSV